MIKLVVFDIDGVLTDGSYLIDHLGNEYKRICFKDLDSFNLLKQLNIKTMFLTSEANFLSKYFQKKFNPNYFFDGVADKFKVLTDFCTKNNYNLQEVCYVGDGKKDLEAMKNVGLSIAPRNSIREIKQIATCNLEVAGGSGVVYEVYNILLNINTEYTDNNTLKRILNEHKAILSNMENNQELLNQLKQSIDIIINALRNKKIIYACGNGGSASDAQHFVAELISKFNYNRKSLGAVSLTTNPSIITSIGNDYNFDNIFKRQIEGLGNNGDVLVALSTSGNSNNIVLAIKEALAKRMKVLFFTSEKCNSLDNENMVILKVPSSVTPRIQEIHIMLIHYLCEEIENYFMEEKNEK